MHRHGLSSDAESATLNALFAILERSLSMSASVAAEVDDQSDTIAPLHKAAYFDPATIVGCPPQSWVSVSADDAALGSLIDFQFMSQVDFLLSMATALPIQMHMEPQVLGESGGPPLFRRAEAMIRTIPELDFLIS